MDQTLYGWPGQGRLCFDSHAISLLSYARYDFLLELGYISRKVAQSLVRVDFGTQISLRIGSICLEFESAHAGKVIPKINIQTSYNEYPDEGFQFLDRKKRSIHIRFRADVLDSGITTWISKGGRSRKGMYKTINTNKYCVEKRTNRYKQ